MTNLDRGPARCFLPSFGSFGKAISEQIFKNRPMRKKNYLCRPCLLTDRDKISNIYRGPSKDGSYHVLIHLATRFQKRRFFRDQPIRNMNCLWRPCLFTDRNQMNNLYRVLPRTLPTKFRFIWQKGFRGEDFLEINQSEAKIACGGHVCLRIATR